MVDNTAKALEPWGGSGVKFPQQFYACRSGPHLPQQKLTQDILKQFTYLILTDHSNNTTKCVYDSVSIIFFLCGREVGCSLLSCITLWNAWWMFGFTVFSPVNSHHDFILWSHGKRKGISVEGKRKVGIRYEARSRGRSSLDSLAFCACETPRR